MISYFFPFYFRKFFQGGQFKNKDIRLDAKVVIITGANSGIGKEAAIVNDSSLFNTIVPITNNGFLILGMRQTGRPRLHGLPGSKPDGEGPPGDPGQVW